MPDDDHLLGRSLSWARRIKGESPMYATAHAAAVDPKAERFPFTEDTLLPVGAVLFYDSYPYGDVGIYVGNETVLRLRGATPVVRRLVRDPIGQLLDTPTDWATRINP